MLKQILLSVLTMTNCFEDFKGKSVAILKYNFIIDKFGHPWLFKLKEVTEFNKKDNLFDDAKLLLLTDYVRLLEEQLTEVIEEPIVPLDVTEQFRLRASRRNRAKTAEKKQTPREKHQVIGVKEALQLNTLKNVNPPPFYHYKLRNDSLLKLMKSKEVAMLIQRFRFEKMMGKSPQCDMLRKVKSLPRTDYFKTLSQEYRD